MSKRLQIVVDDAELQRFESSARAQGQTVSAWARDALRKAERAIALGGIDQKLETIRRAARYEFPAPDIETMLGEIESGYVPRLPQ